MSIRILESASADDDTLVHVTLSHSSSMAPDAPSCSPSPEPKSDVASSASFEASRVAHAQMPASTTLGKPAAESQTETATKQQPSMEAVSKADKQPSIPILPELPVMTRTAATAESLPSSLRSSAPVSRVLGGALSQSWGLPLPWPLPSWRPATTPAATTAAISATTTAGMTSAVPATPPTMLYATTPAATPAASSAANAWPATTPATKLASSEAQAIADSHQEGEPSLADRAFHRHGASEATASPRASSPPTTAQAFASNLSPESSYPDEICRTCVSVPLSGSAQPLESTQQQHVPKSVPDNSLPKHFPLSAAASLSVTLPAVADADVGKTATSQKGVQRGHDHPHLGSGSLIRLEEPSERTVPEATLSAHAAAPDSAEHDSGEHSSTEKTHLKPEQQALLAKGLQLCIQVQQVPPLGLIPL